MFPQEIFCFSLFLQWNDDPKQTNIIFSAQGAIIFTIHKKITDNCFGRARIRIKMNYEELPEGHPDYYDYYDYNYTGDWGWDTEPRVKIPGFGFVPAKVDAKLNAMTQVRDYQFYIYKG